MKQLIEGFRPQGGQHCITNSLKQMFAFYGHPLSEEMLFGLGEGLDFTYLNLSASPMISGRSPIGTFEKTLSERLQIGMKVKEQKDYTKAFAKTKQMLAAGHPVLCYADMPYLRYFSLEEERHFGGHSIILYGYDEEKGMFYVSDRDNSDYPIRTPKGEIQQDYHLVSAADIQKARSSHFRPFPANNKYISFDFSTYGGINEEGLITAIHQVCQKMLHPPAHLKGLHGIRKFSNEVVKWRKFSREKLSQAGATNYFMIHGDGGTGGGIFRKMYGRFLIEAAEIINSEEVKDIGNQFLPLSVEWDTLADAMWKLYETSDAQLLGGMAEKIAGLYDKELALFALMNKIVETINKTTIK